MLIVSHTVVTNTRHTDDVCFTYWSDKPTRHTDVVCFTYCSDKPTRHTDVVVIYCSDKPTRHRLANVMCSTCYTDTASRHTNGACFIYYSDNPTDTPVSWDVPEQQRRLDKAELPVRRIAQRTNNTDLLTVRVWRREGLGVGQSAVYCRQLLVVASSTLQPHHRHPLLLQLRPD